MKKRLVLVLVASVLAPSLAQAQPTAPATTQASAGFSVATSKIGDILDNPAAKAIFAKYFPDVVTNPQLSQGLDMTLPQIQQYVPDMTDEKLAAMDAELKALPK